MAVNKILLITQPTDIKGIVKIKQKIRPTVFAILVLVLLSSGLLSACSGNTASAANPGDLAMASMDGMPAEVKSAPPTVQQAYQIAVANPGVMKQIPCYCGCGKMGHTSNYSCYAQSLDDKGVVTYDAHPGYSPFDNR